MIDKKNVYEDVLSNEETNIRSDRITWDTIIITLFFTIFYHYGLLSIDFFFNYQHNFFILYFVGEYFNQSKSNFDKYLFYYSYI